MGSHVALRTVWILISLLLQKPADLDLDHLYFRYNYDITKCMFSSGNITEKLRVSKFNCDGETVVDLYAGRLFSEPMSCQV